MREALRSSSPVGGGSWAVVTVWTTVVPGSVTVSFTVSFTVCGAVAPAVLPSSRASRAAARMPATSAPARSRSSSGTRVRRGARAAGTAATCVVPAARSSASRSAPTSSAAELNRCSGSFARPRASTSSSSGGSVGFEADAGGIGALTCAIASAVEDSRSNGRLPVRSSKATTASA